MSKVAVPNMHRSRVRQSVIGLGLAFANVTAWLAIHFYAMFVFDLTWASLPFALVMGAVQCWLSVGLFIISHDAMHGSLAPRRPRLNSAIGASLLFLYAGFAWDKMRNAHFVHHKRPGSSDDPDFDHKNPRHFGRWYMTFLKRYFGWQSVLFVSSVVTIYWLVFGVPVGKIVLLYGAPAILSSVQLFYFGTFRPHRHGVDVFADNHNARSERFGVLASLASCFHFGYHHEHHLNPNVPWWALPGVRRLALNKTNGAAA